MSLSVAFADQPDPEEVEDFLGRIKSAAFDREPVETLLMEWEGDELQIHFDQLKRVLIEHQQYEAAQGFTSNEVLVLRAVETGPDRMQFREIATEANRLREENGLDTNADSTIRQYLGRLVEKGLVEQSGQGPNTYYDYAGP